MTRTALYRAYDDTGQLLYVGITSSFGRRWEEHSRTKPWWPLTQTQTITWCDSRPAAESAELAAIATENPRHNIAGKPDDHPTLDGVPDTIQACGRAVHSLWHDGYSRADALREARGRLPERAEHIVLHNWKAAGGCQRCRTRARTELP